MNQLRLMGVFDEIKGLVFSKFEYFDEGQKIISHEDIIREFVPMKKGFPVVTNFDCGHTFPMLSLPQLTKFGLKAHADGVEFYQLEYGSE